MRHSVYMIHLFDAQFSWSQPLCLRHTFQTTSYTIFKEHSFICRRNVDTFAAYFQEYSWHVAVRHSRRAENGIFMVIS